MRVIVGISGASGAIYGLRLLERLRNHASNTEIHLIMTRSGEKTLFLETGKLAADVRKLADFWYANEDISCRLASGSFHLGHLRNMTLLAEMGAIIAPPVPGFYHHPQTVMDIVDHSIDRVLDLLGLPDSGVQRWDGGAK